MKAQIISKQLIIFGIISAIILSGGCFFTSVLVPSNPRNNCEVSTTEFNSWFESGTVTLNGVVKPANSVTFSDLPNCDFYKWTEQMFLWLTSPSPSKYGGNGLIFDSPVFYDVSPPDASSGQRTFIPHVAGQIRTLSRRAAQFGPQRLPVVIEKNTDRLFEITPTPTSRNGKQLILNKEGQEVEIHSIRTGSEKRPIFMDEKGEIITNARPILRSDLNKETTIQNFIFKDIQVLVGASGNIIDVEQGQAPSGQVLQAQNGSLVYYLTTVNNVFAYFATGVKNGSIPSPGNDPNQAKFPTTQGELNLVTSFASSNGKTLIDPEALAIEIKSSWVEAAGLPDLNSFIQMKGTIPTYDKTDPNHWVANGQKTVNLAMVGMHVVGSTKGHPEMLWGTFEHQSNTPNAAYSYINTANAIVNVPQNTNGNWVFCANNASGSFNLPHMSAIGPDIQATAPFSISPSNTIRWKPWGAASNVKPNPLVSSTADSNSNLISINNSVRGKLIAGDIRANYFQIGTTWTINGQAPSNTNQVGTSKLANTTMETYQQGNNTQNNGSNCFSCHSTNKTLVSHIFPSVQPLF